MKRTYLLIPAFCLTAVFGCDSDRRTAHSDGYQETDGLNEAESPEAFENANTDDALGGEGSFEVEAVPTSAEGVTEDTQEFLSEAASSSMLEIQLAQLALEKSASAEVTEYAQMIASDHRQAIQKLETIAQQLNFTLPETMMEEEEEKIEELRELSGSEFEEEFMNKQAELHEKSINQFEGMAEDVLAPEVQEWVENTLTVLRQHKEQAQEVLIRTENNNL